MPVDHFTDRRGEIDSARSAERRTHVSTCRLGRDWRDGGALAGLVADVGDDDRRFDGVRVEKAVYLYAHLG